MNKKNFLSKLNMSNPRRKHKAIILTIIITIVIFIAPFFLRSRKDDLFALLSLSLTAIGAFATVATFIVAILVYDKFGLEQKFIVKQTDKVLELIDLLKGKVIFCKTGKFRYSIRPSPSQLNILKSITFYKQDKKKVILLSYDDYITGTKEILLISKSSWLPKEIKDKIEFLEISMSMSLEDSDDIDEFVLLDFGTGLKGRIGMAYPEITFEHFNNSLQTLVSTIENWLAKNSSFEIDFKLEEAEK